METLESAAWYLHPDIEAGAAADSEVVRDAINRAQIAALDWGYARGEFSSFKVPVHAAKFLAPAELDIIEAATYYDATPQMIAEMRGVLAIYNPSRRKVCHEERLMLIDLGDGHVTLVHPRTPSALVVLPERKMGEAHEAEDAHIVLRGTGIDGERIYTTGTDGVLREGVKVTLSTESPQITKDGNGRPVLFTQLTGAWKSQSRYPVAVFATDANFEQAISERRVPRMDLLARLQSWETQCSRRLYEVRGCRPGCSCLTVFGRLRFRPAVAPSDPLIIQSKNLLRHHILKQRAERSENTAQAAYHGAQIKAVSEGNLERHKGPTSEGIQISMDCSFHDVRTL